MSVKTLTSATHPKNRIIKALLKKDYTGIIILWHSAMERTRGFVLMCDQIDWMKLGPCIETSLNAIQKLPAVVKGDKNGNV